MIRAMVSAASLLAATTLLLSASAGPAYQSARARPASVVPTPRPVRIFSDWAIGCDNINHCEGTSLSEVNDQMLILGFTRSAGPQMIAQFSAQPGFDTAEFMPTRNPTNLRLVTETGAIVAQDISADQLRSGPRGHRMLLTVDRTALLRRSSTIQLMEGNTVLGRASLTGLNAAMLYSDDVQGRLNSLSALVRIGPRPTSSVPEAPAQPVIRVTGNPRAATPALQPTPAQISAMQRGAGCPTDASRTAGLVTPARRLDATHSLFLAPCELFAYNGSSAVYVGRLVNGRAVWAPARFDDVITAGGDGDGPNGARQLMGAQWSPRERRLSGYYKGRGLGDCGTGNEHVWDGSRFRLTMYRDMPECRGSVNWLRTWSARVE